MNQVDIIKKLKSKRIVAVIRGESKDEGIQTAISCIKGGITAIEITYTNAHASEVISELNRLYHEQEHILIGAGTVLDAVTARQAIMLGARYIVSPSFSSEVAQLCHLYAIPYLPGCMTPTEITTALQAGCEIVKLFPSQVFNQVYISAIKAPLPQVSLMVTGGVNLKNKQEWFDAGADVIGIGGEFNRLASQGKFEQITQLAKAYVEQV